MDEFTESEYFNHLYKEGLSPKVMKFFEEMTRINQRSMTYFMIMALEELMLYLDQQPHYDVDLDDDEIEKTGYN